MGRKALSDRAIKALKTPSRGKRAEILDAIMPGLGVRCTDNGVKSFFLRARFPGASARNHATRRTLGIYGAITLEQARDKARAWHKLLTAGIDPGKAEAAAKLELQQRQANSFAVVAEAFIQHCHRTGQRKARAVERELRSEFVAVWGARAITEIASRDVVAVIDAAIARGAVYQAHNLLGHIRRLFNWAIARGVYGLEHSPCERLRPRELIGKRAMRTRVLGEPELRAFWAAAGAMAYPWGPYFRLLLLTMQRRTELASARWQEIDLDRAMWTVPAARMKGDAPHVVPLAPLAHGIFASLPTFPKGSCIFSTTFGAKPISGFSKAKRVLEALMLTELRKSQGEATTLASWGLHDLRRTGRTALSALPVAEVVRELVIAHAKPGLHKVYDQHAYVDEKRHALALWETRLLGILEAAR